jgi:multimeric flavodoxin WrbA
MKITVINGSPHKGNTFQLVQRIESYFQKSKDTQFSYIHLALCNLKTCLGCFQCIRNGHTNCPLQDDQQQILNEMLSSDGIILVSPVYNYNVSSIMKNFIDRFSFIGHRPIFFNQHLLIASSAAGIGLRQIKNYMTNFIGDIWGFRSTSFIGFIKSPSVDINTALSKIEPKIERYSNHFQKKINNSKWKPSFHHIDQFCTMRMIWTLTKMKNAFPFDNSYYSSLKGKHFYNNIKVNNFLYFFSLIKSKLLGIMLQAVLNI